MRQKIGMITFISKKAIELDFLRISVDGCPSIGIGAREQTLEAGEIF